MPTAARAVKQAPATYSITKVTRTELSIKLKKPSNHFRIKISKKVLKLSPKEARLIKEGKVKFVTLGLRTQVNEAGRRLGSAW